MTRSATRRTGCARWGSSPSARSSNGWASPGTGRTRCSAAYRRPNAKDDQRAKAVELRAGWSVNDIALKLGVARSTAYQWVKHLPLDRDSEAARERRRAHSKRMTDALWSAHREARDKARAEAGAAAGEWVQTLSDRELILIGAAIYWCEGAKAKPWRPNDCRVKFVNSDPMLVTVFLRFVAAIGIARSALRFRVSIHESANAEAAVQWWSAVVGIPAESFAATTLKRHQPRTTRLNTGEDYHGCLTIEVPRSRELYWRIEGVVAALARGEP